MCEKEFKDGEFANLGIGLPTMVADYIPDDIMVTFHSENGFAGIDAMADESNLDVDIINSGGSYVTAVDRVKYFDTAESFGLVRRTCKSHRPGRNGSCRNRRPGKLDRTRQESCRYGRNHGPVHRMS